MNRNTYFTPGPSQLYFTAPDHLKEALKQQVASISHRSGDFQKIFAEASTNLRELLQLPDDYHIVFTSSATEIWERILQNCVESHSYHLVNGAFSERFYKYASQLGKSPQKLEAKPGECSAFEDIQPGPDNELIAFTQNETSTGATQPTQDIYQARERFPDSLIAVDAVSIIPTVDFDYSKVDTAYFSVQKCFGLPAGLGVWLVNQRAVEKAETLAQKGQILGTYHTLPGLVKSAQKNQTPETPNVLGIYLLAKVAHDMLTKGLDQIRNEIQYKSAVLYEAVEKNPNLSPFVKSEKHRSPTVVVAECNHRPSPEIVEQLQKDHLVVGKGYGQFKEQHIRIANFPTHSKEKVEQLADLLEKI